MSLRSQHTKNVGGVQKVDDPANRIDDTANNAGNTNTAQPVDDSANDTNDPESDPVNRLDDDPATEQRSFSDASVAKLSRRLEITGRRHRIALYEAVEEGGKRFKDTTVAPT